MRISVCMAGATGWAGSALARGVARESDMQLTAAVARSTAGLQLGEVLEEPKLNATIYATAAEALEQPCDVFVEYSAPSVARANVETALRAGAHVVIGTSGLTDEELNELGELASAKGLGVLACGNFAISFVLLQKFAEMAATYLPHWEIIDYAHASKIDAPSGTVRELAARLGNVGAAPLQVAVADTKGPPESRGATLSGTQVHAVRLPGYTIGAEVIFGGDGETLTLRASGGSSAEPYVTGALIAIRKVGGLRGLHRGLDAVLDL